MTFEVLKAFEVDTPSGALTLKEGQRVRLSKEEAIPLIENETIEPVGKASYKIYSKILDAYLRIVADDEEMKALRSEGIKEAIYTHNDIRELKKLSKKDLKTIHKVKEVFPDAKVEDVKINEVNRLTN